VQAEVPDVFLCIVNWWTAVDAKPFFTQPGDHAGEMETSMLLHVAPELVLPLSEAGSGSARKSRVAAMRDGWAWAPRRWTAVTDDTGVGDPSDSTAEKWEKFFRAATERISGFLVALAQTDPHDLYER
jgi:creatinine amidohydrolase